MGAIMRLAVMPGNGLRLPAPGSDTPPGNLKPSDAYSEEPTKEGACACGAGDAAGDWNSPVRLPDLAPPPATTTCSGAVEGRESALTGRSPCTFPLAACRHCGRHINTDPDKGIVCKRRGPADVLTSGSCRSATGGAKMQGSLVPRGPKDKPVPTSWEVEAEAEQNPQQHPQTHSASLQPLLPASQGAMPGQFHVQFIV